MNDIINDPVQALTKGWSLLSVGMDSLSKAAVEGAKVAAHNAGEFTKYANENYVRPASQHLADPNLRNNVSAYVSNLTKKVNRNFEISICLPRKKKRSKSGVKSAREKENERDIYLNF